MTFQPVIRRTLAADAFTELWTQIHGFKFEWVGYLQSPRSGFEGFGNYKPYVSHRLPIEVDYRVDGGPVQTGKIIDVVERTVQGVREDGRATATLAPDKIKVRVKGGGGTISFRVADGGFAHRNVGGVEQTFELLTPATESERLTALALGVKGAGDVKAMRWEDAAEIVRLIASAEAGIEAPRASIKPDWARTNGSTAAMIRRHVKAIRSASTPMAA